jgi:hypothetical protein
LQTFDNVETGQEMLENSKVEGPILLEVFPSLFADLGVSFESDTWRLGHYISTVPV